MQLLLALLLQAVLSPAQQPDIETIRLAMLERLRQDADRQTAGARWTKERTDEDITKPLEPKVERRERFRVWGDGRRMLQQKVSHDGREVTEPVQPLPFFLEPELLSQFEFSLDEPAEVCCHDHRCWRLSFAPRPDARVVDGDLERKLLALSAGTLLVEQGTYVIVRADAHLLEPYCSWKFDVLWFAVSLTQVHHGDVMVTSTIEMSYTYDPIFGGPKTKRRFYRTVGVTMPEPPS